MTNEYAWNAVNDIIKEQKRRKEKAEAEEPCGNSPTLLHVWEFMPTSIKNPTWKKQCVICATIRNVDITTHANKAGFDVRIRGRTKKLKG